jgi:hypothetical protein
MSIEVSLEEMMESSGRNSKIFTPHVPSYFLPSELFNGFFHSAIKSSASELLIPSDV